LKNASNQRIRNIFLIGFSGSGKSTIGPRLAHRLGVDFCDSDQLIEEAAGKNIDQIINSDGEAVFRSYEAQIIMTLTERLSKATIIALGGGAFQNRSNRELIDAAGLVIYLSCSVRELYRRLRNCSDRPLLSAGRKGAKNQRKELLERIQRLLSSRRANYRKADIIYSTTGKDIDATVSDLVKLIRSRSWRK